MSKEEQNAEKEKELHAKYMEMQMVNGQMQQLHQQSEMIEQQCVELERAQQSLDDLSKAKAGSESFVTLAPGIFSKAKVESAETVLVNVGASVFVEKKVIKTRDDVAAQVSELRAIQREFAIQMEKLTEKAISAETSLKGLVE
jgi:prefoldin alpha subunit